MRKTWFHQLTMSPFGSRIWFRHRASTSCGSLSAKVLGLFLRVVIVRRMWRKWDAGLVNTLFIFHGGVRLFSDSAGIFQLSDEKKFTIQRKQQKLAIRRLSKFQNQKMNAKPFEVEDDELAVGGRIEERESE